MVTAHPAQNWKLAITLITITALTFPKMVRAVASVQECTTGSTCVVGEYLYDDNYAPVSSSTCNLTSYDPANAVYQNNLALTGTADGWYAASFTAPTTTGFYRAQICCTTGSDYMCLDKGFNVTAVSSTSPSSSDIAQSVWEYSSRNLTTDIGKSVWEYSSRSLSGFGDLVSTIWSSTSRTLTPTSGAGSLAKLQASVDQNRVLLEKLVNQPVVQTTIEDAPVSLSDKLDASKDIISQIEMGSSYLNSRAGLLTLKWNSLTNAQLEAELSDLTGRLGEPGADDPKTLLGQINWLAKSWNWAEVAQADGAAKTTYKLLTALHSEIVTQDKNQVSYADVKSLLANLTQLDTVIGGSSDSRQNLSLYGELNQANYLASLWDGQQKQAEALLSQNIQSKDISTNIDTLQKQVLATNFIPRGAQALVSKTVDEPQPTILKNRILALRGLVGANRSLLALGPNKSLVSTWLEEGSLVFKSLITNPSGVISQVAKVDYLLPQEVTKENIISVDDGLTVAYDTDSSRLRVQGEFTLKPGESRTLVVHTQDVWTITDDQIQSLRKQADELSRPLEKTAFFAQGVTLKSDIDVSLDKISTYQKDASTPEQRIKSYREAQIEMGAVQVKMEKLKELVTQAGSAGSFLGFVGGSQAIAVWGLIIVMGAGFVFLVLYMRTVTGGLTSQNTREEKAEEPVLIPVKVHKQHGRWSAVAIFLVFGLTVAAISAGVSRQLVLSKLDTSTSEAGQVSGVQTEVPVPSPEAELAVGGPDIIKIVVPADAVVNVYSQASVSAVLTTVKATSTAIRLATAGDWTQVDLGDAQTQGWVANKFVLDPQHSAQKNVTISDTPTGWLRVREEPDGKEIARVNPGESYPVLAENETWWQIQLTDGTKGWISRQFGKLADEAGN